MKNAQLISRIFEGLSIAACFWLGFALLQTAHAEGPPETEVARHELARWKLPEASLKLLAAREDAQPALSHRERAVLGLHWQHSGGLGAWVDMRERDQPSFGLGWRRAF
jgi:hypothetical protein